MTEGFSQSPAFVSETFYTFAAMKRLLTYIIIVLVLGACTGRERYAAMRNGLDSINQRNRNGQPFTMADVQPYVDYFDRHGNGNDRLLAHYLLGRAYYDHGEAPMALKCYQDAVEQADTTDKDCDYKQLSRVYGQMADIFYYQSLYRQQLVYQVLATTYAWKGKDTLAALMCYEQQCFAYKRLGLIDSAVFITEDVARLYKEYGYPTDAAITLGTIARDLVDKGERTKAKNYMDQYESKSGYFDEDGNIQKGREIYYNAKGKLHLTSNILDSAEYWFRKELRDGSDFNNQNAGAYGLAMVYEQRHQPDSAAKYYRHAYAMNDSMYAQQATTTVERMQAMYNYSRHQEIARQEREKALQEANKKRIILGVLIIVALISAFIIFIMISKKRKQKLRYIQNLSNLEKAQSEIMQLREHSNDYQELIAEKECEIEILKSEIENRQQKTRQNHATTTQQIQDSEIYKELKERERLCKALTKEQIRKIRIMVIEKLPDFNSILLENKYMLRENDFNVCMLLRLGIKSKEISVLLKISQPRVSQICTKVLGTIFNENKGGAKELEEELHKYY